MIPPSQTAAASSKLIAAGLCATAALSRAQTYSAWAPGLDAEDLVAGLERRDGRAHGLDHACELAAEDRPLRPQEAGEDAGEERVRGAPAAVRPVHGRGADPDQDLVLVRHGLLDVGEPEHVRRSVPVVDDGSHVLTSHVGGGRRLLVLVAMTVTLPRGYGHVNQNCAR